MKYNELTDDLLNKLIVPEPISSVIIDSQTKVKNKNNNNGDTHVFQIIVDRFELRSERNLLLTVSRCLDSYVGLKFEVHVKEIGRYESSAIGIYLLYIIVVSDKISYKELIHNKNIWLVLIIVLLLISITINIVV